MKKRDSERGRVFLFGYFATEFTKESAEGD
jgi:hypothetical protein